MLLGPDICWNTCSTGTFGTASGLVLLGRVLLCSLVLTFAGTLFLVLLVREPLQVGFAHFFPFRGFCAAGSFISAWWLCLPSPGDVCVALRDLFYVGRFCGAGYNEIFFFSHVAALDHAFAVNNSGLLVHLSIARRQHGSDYFKNQLGLLTTLAPSG